MESIIETDLEEIEVEFDFTYCCSARIDPVSTHSEWIAKARRFVQLRHCESTQPGIVSTGLLTTGHLTISPNHRKNNQATVTDFDPDITDIESLYAPISAH